MSYRAVTPIAITVSTLCIISPLAMANIIVNGGFEDNLNSDTIYNMSNTDFSASMFGVTAFGGADEVDIIHRANSDFGLPAIEGDWSVALHSSSFTGENDAISMSLGPQLRAGEQFRVELFAQMSTEFDPGNGFLEVGLSSSADSFGTLVHSFDISTPNEWVSYSADFFSTNAFGYLTFRTVRSGSSGVWVHLDAVSLTSVDVPSPGVGASLSILAIASCRRRRR